MMRPTQGSASLRPGLSNLAPFGAFSTRSHAPRGNACLDAPRRSSRVARPSHKGGRVPACRDKRLRHARPNGVVDASRLCPPVALTRHGVEQLIAADVVEPTWRSLLSLRDPAGASHPAGPPLHAHFTI